MEEEGAELGVGFAIDFFDSFGQLKSLDDLIGVAAANAVRQFEKIEAASKGAVNLGGATLQVSTFASAATGAGREMARVESTAEALSRQLERQNTTFGKSRSELRGMKVEAAALAAEQAGLTELAGRLLDQEVNLRAKEVAAAEQAAQAKIAAAERAAQAEMAALERVNAQLSERARLEAAIEQNTGAGRGRATDAGATFSALSAQLIEQEERAAASAAAAVKRLASEHERLAGLVRGSHDAQVADAEAAERLRMATDPLYAATKRLNAEIAESTRLYHAGATAPAEYARQQEVLEGRLLQSVAAHAALDQAMKKNRGSMTQLSFQVNDIVTMAMSGAGAFQIFATQAGQIIQIVQMAEGGFKGFAAELGAAAVAFAPLIVIAGVAAGAFALFDRSVSQGIDTTAMVNGLGLTRAEIKRLKDTSVDAGDVIKATFQVMAQRVGLNLEGMGKAWSGILDWMTTVGRNAMANLYANTVGTFQAMVAAAKALGDGKGISGALSAAGTAYKQSLDDANAALTKFGKDVNKQVASNKLAELTKQANELKADRTPKTDRHADALAREAEATEAQIKNLYALADAYAVSGAAALVAEARVKAESQAIKQRADIEAAVERQIRLAIAQRVSDAAKGTLSTREQAEAQSEVNRLVEAGLVPASRAADLVRGQLADLPLLAALQVAQQRNYTKGIIEAQKALENQRNARLALTKVERAAQFNTEIETGERQLEMLQKQLELIGATDAARVHSLATLKATQEAASKYGDDPAKAQQYIDQQVAIADQTEQLRLTQDEYNKSLSFTIDLWSEMVRNVDNAGRGMADAFGNAGQALGDMASSMVGYLASQDHLKKLHATELASISQIKDETLKAQRTEQENALFAAQNLTAQVGLYGDMTAAAKGFFKEGSDGYQAMAAAEKAFRAVEFALSVKAMAQDAIETASSIAKSGARTATKAVEAVVSAISSLPFPLNIAAGAATIAALASIGVAVAGSFGGNKNTLEKANDGTGTVLGDASAKSESIKRSIDALKEVDTTMLSYSRAMAASLASIDNQIGNLATLVVRTGDINASAGVSEGFQSNLLGKTLSGGVSGLGLGAIGTLIGGPIGFLAGTALGAVTGIVKKIPIIGDIVGGIGSLIGSLFGTKTKVVGSGLYGGAQSLGDILANGFDADYYSDIQKKKKFFGLTTSTKYSTQYTDADAGLANQFTLILSSFNDAILAAAGPLGESTDAIEKRLNSFVLNIGKIDLQGLTGEEISDKLEAVFGAAADDMAAAAFPGIAKFQAVGEGLFETLVRVATTVETVTSNLDLLGSSAAGMSVDLKMALAGQFDSVSDFSSAIDSYFSTYYDKSEQAAASTAQFAKVFDSLGVAMPTSLSGFRALVEAQDLTTTAGQSTYATLLQLAPAFASLQSALGGAATAADILSQRENLQRQLLEAQGDTAAIRALDLAKLDESNRALQEQVWAVQDAKEAADAAAQLKEAWTSVGDSIMDEVNRIRGITDGTSSSSFATLLGQFNAASAAARAGDQDAAGTLTSLSQALLTAAANSATSKQELDRVKAQTATSLELSYAAIQAFADSGTSSTDTLTAAATAAAASGSTSAANDDVLTELKALRAAVDQARTENNSGHAATAGNTGSMKKTLDNVTAQSGGDAISTVAAA